MEPMITLSVEDYNKLVKSNKKNRENLIYILEKLKIAYDNEKRGCKSDHNTFGTSSLTGLYAPSFEETYRTLIDLFKEKEDVDLIEIFENE